MSSECVDNFDGDVQGPQEEMPETSASKKLERRRRIEDLFEKKKLEQEFGELDLF